MSMTVDQFKAALLAEYPTRDWDQMCARLVWNAVWLTTGIPESQMVTYGSAIEGARASTIVSRDPNAAPIAAVHHWEMGRYGHDGVSLGGGMMLHTSDYANNVEKWAAHVFIASVASYSLGSYLGWSHTFGRNIPIALTQYTPAVRPKDDVRRVAAALNARGLGRTSSSDVDGIPGPNLYWMIQTAGTQDGIYNGAIDGVTGPKTEAAFDTYVQRTKATIPAEPTPPTPIPDPVPTPKTWLNGIDISGYQEGLDLSNVPCDFVIVKATQGTTFISTETHKFMEQAISLGKKVGIYHFADGGDVNAEADWFLLNAKRYAGKAIPVLDFEGAVLAQGAPWALAWLKRVEAGWGAKPWFYTSGSVASQSQYQALADAGYLLWRAAYGDNESGGYEKAPLDPTIDRGVWPKVTARQFLSTGKLAGWDKNLDLNIFYGLEGEWDAMVKVALVVPPTPEPKPEEPVPVDTAPNWFVNFIMAIVNAITLFFKKTSRMD